MTIGQTSDDEIRFPSEEYMMKYLSEEASDESAEPINTNRFESPFIVNFQVSLLFYLHV